MYLATLLLLATVSARDISQNGHIHEGPHQERFHKQFEPLLEPNQRQAYENINYHSQNHHVNLNHEQFRQNNREIGDDRRDVNERNNDNDNQGRSHGNTGRMPIYLAFDRQAHQNRGKHSNLNAQRQSFNITNEYSNSDSDNNGNSKYNENILQARRQQDEMAFDNHRRRLQDGQENVNQDGTGIVSFINNVNNNTNRNEDKNSRDQNRNNQRGNQGRFKSAIKETYDPPNTTMENEVTKNPTQNGVVDKENRTLGNDDWVWGVVETTTMVVNVTVDDRAAFTGGTCATGMVKVMGRCVEED